MMRKRLSMTAAMIGLLIAAGVARAGANISGSEVWFGDLHEGVAAVDRGRLDTLVRAAWGVLHGQAGGIDAAGDRGEPRIVFLSACDGKTPAMTVQVGRRGLGAAVAEATRRMAAQWQAMHHAAPPIWLRLDAVHSVAARGVLDGAFVDAFQRDRDSLALGDRKHHVALLSPQLLGRGWIDDKQQLAVELMQLDDPQFAALWKIRPLDLYRFQTVGAFYDGDHSVPLTDGYREQTDITPDQLERVARLAGDYLTRATDAHGHLDYIYYPITDSLADDYDIVRHVGAIYVMARVYELAHDAKLRAAMDRTLDYALRRTHVEPGAAGSAAAMLVDDHGMTYLGSNALLLLSLTEYTRVTGDRSHMATAQQLADGIMSQMDHDGRFTVYAMRLSDHKVTRDRMIYYTGEALWSLVHFYSLTKQPNLLDAAERGVAREVALNAGKSDAEIEQDHWLMYAIAELTQYVKAPAAYAYAIRLCRVIDASQHTAAADPLWAGAWGSPPYATPAATRAEGLGADYLMFIRHHDQPHADAALATAERAIRFQMRCFVGGDRAMFFANPARVLGAFTAGLDLLDVRIDYIQHNACSMLTLRQILLDRAAHK